MLLEQMAINGMASSSSSSPPFFPPNFLLQIQNNHHHHDPQEVDHHQLHHHHHQPLSSLLSSNPQDYRSMATMLGKRSMSFSGGGIEAGCEDGGGGGEDDLSDDCSGLGGGEKKRRLSVEQVRTLEKNFEIGNKLEPERKMQLARALGLQPRQVAIWFQNRRARWKTKQLEKDYDLLKRHFDAVNSENDALLAHNKKLQAEISFLRGGGRETSELINLNKETEGSCSNRSENSSEINLDISRAAPATESPLNPNPGIPFFPTTSIRPPPPPTMVQLLQSTTAASASAAGPKIEHNAVHDENFSNLLCSMDDQSAFWPWSDPQSFH